MVEVNPERFKTPPFRHQVEGVKALVCHRFFALFDEMRLGKSKQVVDAACTLYDAGELDRVVVVAPASVRAVWSSAADPDGEIVKHAWVPCDIYEFHAAALRATAVSGKKKGLEWWVTNYEFIRNPVRCAELVNLLKSRRARTALVLDESSFIKSRRAQQTRACLALAPLADRRVILNGTPWTHSPLDLWAQLKFVDPRALPFKNFFSFSARYAVMGGWMNKQVVRYQNLDELTDLVSPYCLRRTLEDCFDLPESVETFREVALGYDAWRHYRTVRDEFIVWLDTAEPTVVASTAAVKALRLAQLTGGFLGGAGEDGGDEPLEVGAEKLNAVIDLLADAREPAIVWCRFRAERARLARRLRETGRTVYEIYGAQPRADREKARAAFAAGSATVPPNRVLVAQPQAGGWGLDLSAATLVVYYSSDFNALTRWQSEKRAVSAVRPRTREYVDILASGPDGQKTVDHLIRKVIRAREELARWTSARWRRALE